MIIGLILRKMAIYHRTSFPALRKIKQAPVLRHDRGGKRTADPNPGAAIGELSRS
jgi:hypothetical protein